MKKWIFTCLAAFIASTSIAQVYTQTVRGNVVDSDNKISLIGVNILIINGETVHGTTTDENGNYSVENIPIGRATVQFSYLGYEEKTIPNVVVNSAKEQNQERFADFMISTPEERYLSLIEQRPNLLTRIPQYHLASFLGIKPESLSRIRKRLAQK